MPDPEHPATSKRATAFRALAAALIEHARAMRASGDAFARLAGRRGYDR